MNLKIEIINNGVNEVIVTNVKGLKDIVKDIINNVLYDDYTYSYDNSNNKSELVEPFKWLNIQHNKIKKLNFKDLNYYIDNINDNYCWLTLNVI